MIRAPGRWSVPLSRRNLLIDLIPKAPPPEGAPAGPPRRPRASPSSAAVWSSPIARTGAPPSGRGGACACDGHHRNVPLLDVTEFRCRVLDALSAEGRPVDPALELPGGTLRYYRHNLFQSCPTAAAGRLRAGTGRRRRARPRHLDHRFLRPCCRFAGVTYGGVEQIGRIDERDRRGGVGHDDVPTVPLVRGFFFASDLASSRVSCRPRRDLSSELLICSLVAFFSSCCRFLAACFPVRHISPTASPRRRSPGPGCRPKPHSGRPASSTSTRRGRRRRRPPLPSVAWPASPPPQSAGPRRAPHLLNLWSRPSRPRAARARRPGRPCGRGFPRDARSGTHSASCALRTARRRLGRTRCPAGNSGGGRLSPEAPSMYGAVSATSGSCSAASRGGPAARGGGGAAHLGVFVSRSLPSLSGRCGRAASWSCVGGRWCWGDCSGCLGLSNGSDGAKRPPALLTNRAGAVGH